MNGFELSKFSNLGILEVMFAFLLDEEEKKQVKREIMFTKNEQS